MSSIQRAFDRQRRVSWQQSQPRVRNLRRGRSYGPGFYGPRQYLGGPVLGRAGGVTRTIRMRARRPIHVWDLPPSPPTFDLTNARLMPRPPVIIGRPDTYIGPSRVPAPQEGEVSVTKRRYWKMRGIGVSFAEGSAVLYRSGADHVWRNYDTHALEASFPSPAAQGVLDRRMLQAGFRPYQL